MSVLTIAVSNTMTAGAAVAVLGPVVLNTAQIAGDDPLTLGYITAISSAFGYLTAAAQPAFTIIYASGYLKAKDFMRIGWKMMVISFILLQLMASFYWPAISGL
jgi:sodium-dependent dicarboxylate transporter 2/3/5